VGLGHTGAVGGEWRELGCMGWRTIRGPGACSRGGSARLCVQPQPQAARASWLSACRWRYGSVPARRRSMQVFPDAHDSPIQCADLCSASQQLAVCGQGNQVNVWSFGAEPLQPQLHVVLDHSKGVVNTAGDAATAAAGAGAFGWLA
jgi:hypothetical protein